MRCSTCGGNLHPDEHNPDIVRCDYCGWWE